MNIVERIENVLSFRQFDRLPMIEWAWWWTKTTDRWYTQGLPGNLQQAHDVREYLKLDRFRQFWVRPIAETCPKPETESGPLVTSMDEYIRIKPYLFPKPGFDRGCVGEWAKQHGPGEMAIWFWIEGFFWFPRTLFGIENHIYAFYDQTELMHRMNADLLEYNLQVIDEICKLYRPTFLLIAEDMSYNHGPMISKQCFDEFMAPYYKKLITRIKEYGIMPFIDTDGNVTGLIPWFEEVGIEGVGPLERMAGVDLVEIRRKHPKLKMIGGFDKTVMHLGESAIRKEFERLLPVMRQGGYLICPDHQTPPEVSLDNYRMYVRLLEEYCIEAAR